MHLLFTLTLLAVAGKLLPDLLTLEDDTIIRLLKPLDGVLLLQAVTEANLTRCALLLAHTVTGAAENDEEVHTVNTSGGVVLDSEGNVLVDTEAKGAIIGEVVRTKLEFLHLQSLFKELLSFLAANRAVAGYFFVTTDTEGTDRELGTGQDGSLATQLLQHF